MNRNRPPAPESSPSEESRTAHGSQRANKVHSFSRGRVTRLIPAVEALEDRTLQTALPPEGSLPWHYVTQTTIPFTTPNAQAVDPSHPHKFIEQYDTTVVGQLVAGVSKHTASVLSKPNDAGALDPLLSIVKKGKDTLDDTVRHINAAHLLLDDAEMLLAGWQAKGAPAFDGEPNHQPFSPADFASARISLDVSKAKLDNLTRTAADLKLALDKADLALQEAIKKEVEKQKNLDAATIQLADATSTLDGAKKLLDQKNALVDSTQKALDTDTSALNVLQAKVAAAHAIFWKAAEDYIPVARESEAHPEDLVLKARAQALLDICLPLYQNYLTIRNASISPLYVLRSRISNNTIILEAAKVEQASAKSAFDSAHATYINALATVASLQSLLDAATSQRITAQTDRDAKYKAYTEALTSETATLKEGIAVSTILFQRLTATDKTFHNTFDAALDTLVTDERGLTDILHDKQHEGIAALAGQARTVTGLPMDMVASGEEIETAIAALGKNASVILSAYDSAKKLVKTGQAASRDVAFKDDVQPLDVLNTNMRAYVAALTMKAESVRQIILFRVQNSITALSGEGISTADFAMNLENIRTNFSLLSAEEKGLQLTRLSKVVLTIDAALGKATNELNAAKALLSQLQAVLDGAISAEQNSLSHRTWQEVAIDIPNGSVRSSTLSPDGLTITTGGSDGVIRFVDAKTGTVTRQLAIGNTPLSNIVYFPNGNIALTTNKEIKIINAQTGEITVTIPLVNDDAMLQTTVSGNLAGVVQVIGTSTYHLVSWSPDGKELSRVELNPEAYGVNFSKDGKTLFVGIRRWMYAQAVEQGGMGFASDFDPRYGKSTLTSAAATPDNSKAVLVISRHFLRLVDAQGNILQDAVTIGDVEVNAIDSIGGNRFAVDFVVPRTATRMVKVLEIVNNKLIDRSQTGSLQGGIGKILIAPDNSTLVSVWGSGIGANSFIEPNDFYTKKIADAQSKIPPAQAEVDRKTLPIAGLTDRSNSIHATANAVSPFLDSYLVDAALRGAANVDFPLDATTFDTYFENVESALTALEAQPDWTMNTSAGKLNGLALWSGDLKTIGQAIMSMAHGMQLVGPFVEATDRAPVFDSLYHRALAQAQRLSKLVDDWQSTHALFEQEAAGSLTSATFVSLKKNYENLLSMFVQDTDLSGLTNVSSTDSAATYQLDLVDSGGSLTLQSLKGLYDTPATVTITTDQTGTIVTGTGSALSLDFTKAHGSTVKVSLKVLSESGNTVTVAFLQGEKVIAQQTVDSGSVASFEDAAGISGAIIQNEAKGMSDIARDLYDFRATYKYPGYAWQDPGADAFYFGYLHPTIPVADQPRIIAEANAGNLTRAVSIADLSLTNNLSNMDGAFGTVSNTENSLYARMNTPRVPSGIVAVEDRWMQVQYTPNQYNAYTLRSYGGGASVQSIGTIGSGHNFRPLPESMYHREGDTILVYPTSQNLQLLLYTTNDNARYHAGIPVNRRFDFEVISKTGSTSTDALNALGKRMSVDSIRLYNINSGGAEGWSEGRTLEQSRSSPVAIGSIMAQADIVNDSDEALNFTVTTYSGLPGVNGWKNPVRTYASSLAAHSGRTLHTPIQMNTDSQGRGMVRFVITAADGRILAEGERTVGTGSMPESEKKARGDEFMEKWNIAMAQARKDTVAYFASIRQKAPSGTDFDAIIAAAQNAEPVLVSPDPERTKRALEISARALASANASGDESRIAIENKRYDLAVIEHTKAMASMNAKPSESIPTVAQIVMEHQIHFASMQQVAGKIQVAWDDAVSNRINASQLVDPALPSIIPTYADTAGAEAFAASIEEQTYNVEQLPFSKLMKQQINNLLRFFKTDTVQTFVKSDAYNKMIENYNNNIPPIGIVYNTVMNWYKPQNAVPGLTFDVRDDSAIGKAFLGLLQQLEASKGNAQQLSDIGRMIQDLTAIQCQQIMATTLTADVSKRAQQLRTLFGYAGYDRIFTSTPPSADTPPYILSAVTDQPKYTGGDIRFRFDVRTGGAKVVGMQVWLDNIGGQRELVGSEQSTQFYVKVPVSAISKPGVARFIVSITLSDGKVIERKTSSVDMQTELKDLSTASMNTAEGQAQHDLENRILNQVLKNFPLQNPSEWRWDMGSPYHDNQEYYAADLNNGAGSHDEGMEVRAIADGVAHIDIKFGTVVLTHTLKQNGKPDTTWQSEYMHMRIFETTRKNDVDQAIFEIRDLNDTVVGEIAEGQKITASSLVGLVGGKGLNGYDEFSPHSHLVIATGGQSIDVRRLLVDALGIRVTATDGGEDGVVRKINDGQKQFNVAWDTALESWKTDPALGDGNPNLVYDRSAQVSSSSSETPVYWLAWEVDDNNKPITDVTKLSRIVNKKIRWKDANGSTQEADMWVKSNDSSSVWDPINRKFYKVQLI